jgi:predicted DNA-binding transcriptional regulator AlpA
MAIRVLRLRQIATTKGKPGLLPVSPATVWRWIRSGRFPAPFKLGEGTTVWDAAAVDEFITRASGSQGPAA